MVLSEIDFGTTPPEISELMAHSDLPNNCYVSLKNYELFVINFFKKKKKKLDLDLSYEGELRIVVTVGMGKGLVNIKVPIEVNEIRISTRVNKFITDLNTKQFI